MHATPRDHRARTTKNKGRSLARLSMLCLPVAAVVALPMAVSAATTGSTIRATVGNDGSVKSVKVYAPGGSATAFNGQLPVKLSISRTVSGGTSTYVYHVENTFSRQQTVTYSDATGKAHSAQVELQLPLVAQLGVELPRTFTDVSAPQGVVQTDPDGVTRVVFTLVLFSPLGAAAQDISMSASGSGSPVAELTATAVNPASTAGLSATSQDSTATAQQNDFWTNYASGGNDGLTKLAAGMAQIVAGLDQLAPGARQLADGLSGGIADSHRLDVGTQQAYAGSKTIASGTKSAHEGAVSLTAGLGKIHEGNVTVAGGLGQISGGLSQLADPVTGVPAAVDGLKLLQGGLTQIIAGIGPTGSLQSPGLLDGLTAVDEGLKKSQTDLATLDAGLSCAANTIQAVVAGAPAGTTPAGCSTSIPAPLPGIADPVSQAVLVGTPAQPGVALQLLGAQQQLHASLQPPTAANPSTLPAAIAAVEQVMYGLSHTITGATDTGGVKQILALLNGDVVLGKIIAGLQAASTGLGQLSTGAVTAADGAQTLADATGDAATGSKTLDAGLGQLATGTADLASGLAQISMGVHISATSLPSAADGASQIADGADQLRAGAPQVRGGILDLQSQAVEPLLAQLTNGSLNAKKQVAILVAASKLAGQAPGGAGSAYVLSQSPTGFRLAAAKVSGGSNTGRNLGIGLGALAALVISVTAGFVLGRRAQVAQH